MAGDILVLGATGEVGGRVLAGLAAHGEAVRGASREPERAASRRRGRWVALDLERPATFGPALEGVDRLFLVARPGDDHPERVGEPLIAAAVGGGVRVVVTLSAMGVERDPDFGLRRLELLVESSGLSWTHLRPNFFMQVFVGPGLLPGIQAARSIRLPAGEARLSYVDTRDIADVAVSVLTRGAHERQALALTGPAALDHGEIARLLTQAAGHPIVYEALTEPAARTLMAGAGLGAERVERLIGFYRQVRAGLCAPVSPDVESTLGRPARTFAAFAREHASLWRVEVEPGGRAHLSSRGA